MLHTAANSTVQDVNLWKPCF